MQARTTKPMDTPLSKKKHNPRTKQDELQFHTLPAGTLIDDPDCWMLVMAGHALPEDEECEAECRSRGWSKSGYQPRQPPFPELDLDELMDEEDQEDAPRSTPRRRADHPKAERDDSSKRQKDPAESAPERGEDRPATS